MPYVGNKPEVGNFRKCDAITTSATATYNLLVGGVAVNPNQNQVICSLNGVIQSSGTSYTIASSQITFASALTSSDVIDFILILGDVLDVGVPSDDTVDASKITANVITGQSALGVAPADTDEFLVSDAGVLKRVDYSYIKPTAQVFRRDAQPIIINGDMGVAQRGTSVTGKTNGDSGYYTVDRIQFAESGTMTAVITNTQESLSSGNAFNDGFEKAYKIDVTTADASAATDILHRIKYNLEAQSVQAFKFGKTDAQPMTLAFWVKATKTGTNTVHMERGDSARSCAQEYTVSSTDTWEHKVLNFPADTTGNMPYDNGEGLNIQWNLVAGTDYTSGTLCTTWEAFNKPDTAVGQVNNFDSTSNNFHITGIQLEVGTYTSADLPPFQFESYGDNLARCQRYFQKLTNGESGKGLCMVRYWSSTAAGGVFNLPTTMRANPTASYANGTGYWLISGGTGGANDPFDTITNNDTSLQNAGWYSGSSATGTAGYAGLMMTNSTSAKAEFSAEL